MLVDTPRKLKLAHANHVARVEYRDGGEATSREFDLAEALQKSDFLELVRKRDIDTIHTQEPSHEAVFL